MKKPGRPCSICAHVRVAEIDSDARPIARVAAAFGVSPASLQRHRKHATPAHAPRSATERGRQPSAPPPADEGPLDARAVAVDTLKALRACLRGAAPEDVPSIANAITAATRLLARLSGQLEITEVAIVRSSPWRRLMDLLDGVLEKHPEAAKEWAHALDTVER